MTTRDLHDLRPFSIISTVRIAFSHDIFGALVTSLMFAFRLLSSTPVYTSKGILGGSTPDVCLLDNNISTRFSGQWHFVAMASDFWFLS